MSMMQGPNDTWAMYNQGRQKYLIIDDEVHRNEANITLVDDVVCGNKSGDQFHQENVLSCPTPDMEITTALDLSREIIEDLEMEDEYIDYGTMQRITRKLVRKSH